MPMTVHPNSVAWSLYTTLASDTTLVNSKVLVQLHEVLNSDPTLTPWVGVYLDGPVLEPFRVMQGGTPWQATYELSVYLQGYSEESGQDAMDRLMRLATPVFAAVGSNPTLDNTVKSIVVADMQPFQIEREEEDHLFGALITIRAEADA